MAALPFSSRPSGGRFPGVGKGGGSPCTRVKGKEENRTAVRPVWVGKKGKKSGRPMEVRDGLTRSQLSPSRSEVSASPSRGALWEESRHPPSLAPGEIVVFRHVFPGLPTSGKPSDFSRRRFFKPRRSSEPGGPCNSRTKGRRCANGCCCRTGRRSQAGERATGWRLYDCADGAWRLYALELPYDFLFSKET